MFHNIEQWWKIWINPNLVVPKRTWGTGWTFITELKSLANCTVMSSFCPKHIMLQLENFREIICHDTERWYKIKRKTYSWLQKWKELSELSLEHSKVWKLALWWAPFLQRIKRFRWKSTEDKIWRKTDSWFQK